MTGVPAIVALGHVDERSVRGTRGGRTRWAVHGVRPPDALVAMRALSGVRDARFRRLDLVTRAVVIASEAAGVADIVPRGARDDTAIVIETERGTLDTDLRFASTVGDEVVAAALFPFTLSSAGAGELALRHGLRGPTCCLSVGPGGAGAALAEARRLLEDGEALYAVVGRVEALAATRDSFEPKFCATVAVLTAREDAVGVAPWPKPDTDPFEQLASSLTEPRAAVRPIEASPG